jgi:hypothetical protein
MLELNCPTSLLTIASDILYRICHLLIYQQPTIFCFQGTHLWDGLVSLAIHIYNNTIALTPGTVIRGKPKNPASIPHPVLIGPPDQKLSEFWSRTHRIWYCSGTKNCQHKLLLAPLWGASVSPSKFFFLVNFGT